MKKGSSCKIKEQISISKKNIHVEPLRAEFILTPCLIIDDLFVYKVEPVFERALTKVPFVRIMTATICGVPAHAK